MSVKEESVLVFGLFMFLSAVFSLFSLVLDHTGRLGVLDHTGRLGGLGGKVESACEDNGRGILG